MVGSQDLPTEILSLETMEWREGPTNIPGKIRGYMPFYSRSVPYGDTFLLVGGYLSVHPKVYMKKIYKVNILKSLSPVCSACTTFVSTLGMKLVGNLLTSALKLDALTTSSYHCQICLQYVIEKKQLQISQFP